MAVLNIYESTSYAKDLNSAVSPSWKKYDLSADFHAQNLQKWDALYLKNNKLARTYVQAQTLDFIKKNGKKLSLTTAIKHDGILPDVNQVRHHVETQCTISVKEMDCLDAAKALVQQGHSVAVLNMANQFNLGGGYLHGAGAQEEDLCRRTNLSSSLDPSHYVNRDPSDIQKNGFGEFSALYSQKVTVFRASKDNSYAFMDENSRFEISVISSAAYDLNDKNQSNRSNQRYLDGMTHKIVMQLETALQHGHKHLVLSAFGCGAFGNNPATVAQLYKKVLAYPRYQNAFEHIVFAIVPNPGAKNDNYLPFKNTLLNSSKPKITSSKQRLAFLLSVVICGMFTYGLGLSIYASVAMSFLAGAFSWSLFGRVFKTNIKPVSRTLQKLCSHQALGASSNLSDHAKVILADLYQDHHLIEKVVADYENYDIGNGTIFKNADFVVRHGAMHACRTALNIALFAKLYQKWGDQEALKLSSQDMLMLQIVALFHDAGRIVHANDLGRDTPLCEATGAQYCYEYLKKYFPLVPDSKLKLLADTIKNKDKNQNIYCKLLQNADCLEVLRADDWAFDAKYLKFYQDYHTNNAAMDDLHQLVHEMKLFLVSLGDSLQDFVSSHNHQVLQGQFSLANKRKYETNANCFELLEKALNKNKFLKERYEPAHKASQQPKSTMAQFKLHTKKNDQQNHKANSERTLPKQLKKR
ncbi:MAG: TIGR02452 family protein [Candidatus Berkiella sp.]